MIIGALILIFLLIVRGAVEVTYAATATVAETLPTNTGSAVDASRKVTHNAYNETATLNAASTPPATQVAEFLLTLTAGAATIDLRALVGTNGAIVDGNGLKVQIFRFKNLGANPMTIVPGAANGIDLFGSASSLTIPAGGHVMMFFNDASPDIAAADKTLDVTGTAAQTAEVSIIMG